MNLHNTAATPFIDIQDVDRPIESARGLPNALYADPQLFEYEKKRLFSKGWACIGFGKDVPKPGDAQPVNFAGNPLLLLRDKEGVIRVFHNVCRHRGMVLVSEPGPVRNVIRCPYHSWCYGLDGRLVTTPHVGGPGTNVHPDIDRENLGLLPVRSAVFMDMIFVDLSGEAVTFDDYVRPMRSRFKEFSDRQLIFTGKDSTFDLELKANWKLAVENYCESYHLPWVHPDLNAYSRLEDHYDILEPGAFSGQGTTVYRPNLNDDGRTFPDFSNLSVQWAEGAEYVALYPNVLIGVHRDHTFAILLVPLAHDRTLERVVIYYAQPEVAAEEWAKLRAQNAAQWKRVFIEDIFVVEGMQRGRSATAFDGGRFSPAMDGATHCFHRWVAGRFAQ